MLQGGTTVPALEPGLTVYSARMSRASSVSNGHIGPVDAPRGVVRETAQTDEVDDMVHPPRRFSDP